MCGIAVIISRDYVDPKNIVAMTDIIKHRGPDAAGRKSFFDSRVWLGHRRLSILDLSNDGTQPMSYQDGRYCITYNGEIYNFLEVRNELKSKGYSFRTLTDTEVILAAYDCWGKDCLFKFNGMWAFAIIDSFESKIFIARDRFGVKPLYYWYSPDGILAFASEIKQFTVLPGWKGKVNGQRAYDFLRWSQLDHTNETLFKDVYQIRCGCAVECNINTALNSLPIFQWYKMSIGLYNGDFRDAADRFRKLFFESLKLRLRSDVEVGSCLSGGLDSSSIVCSIKDHMIDGGQRFVNTVSAGAKVPAYDESYYINEVLKSRDLKNYIVYPSFDGLFEEIEKIVWHQDEPFGSTSIYAQWSVFKKTMEAGLKVMLDGQGADEHLAGYHCFFAARFAGLFKTLRWIQLLKEINSCREIHGYNYMFGIKGIVSQLLPETVVGFLREMYNGNATSPKWLSMEKLNAEAINPGVFTNEKALSVRELSMSQLGASHLQQLLHYEDRDSMAHSIESRLPFLDYHLVEFVLSLPDEYKLSNGVTKKVLREGMKGIIPEEIRHRMDKKGFVTPEEVWIRKNASFFRRELGKAIESSNGILTDNCFKYFDYIISRRRPFDFTIWRMISFGVWMRNFNNVV